MHCKGNCWQIDNPIEYLDCDYYNLDGGSGTIGPWNLPKRWANTDLTHITDNYQYPFLSEQFNGIDYLLAYNLYRSNYFDYGYYDRIRRTLVAPVPSSAQSTFPGTSQNPYIHKSVFSTDLFNQINNNGNLQTIAGSEINLKPGFCAKIGSVFSAKISEYDCTPVVDKNSKILMYKDGDTHLNETNEFSLIDGIDSSIKGEEVLPLFEDETDDVYPDDIVKVIKVNDSTFSFEMNPLYSFNETGDLIYNTPNTANRKIIDSIVLKSINLYPNPTNDNINLEYYLFFDSNIEITIQNSLGQIMPNIIKQNKFSQNKGSQKLMLNTEILTPGIYFCILTIDGKKEVKKFTIIK